MSLGTAAYYAAGGVLTSLINTFVKRKDDDEVPEDMATLPLVGGGLIAGESLFFLAVGILGLLTLAR